NITRTTDQSVTIPICLSSQVETGFFIVSSQGSKRDHDSEDEDYSTLRIKLSPELTFEKSSRSNSRKQSYRNKTRILRRLMEGTNLLLESISEGTYIISEDEEFLVVKVSGSPSEQDWTHFKVNRMMVVKMLKTLMNRFAVLCPNSDIREIKLYAMQSYLC
ncbi:17777_t:CDS:2, partial [Acaulospora morrowiae]